MERHGPVLIISHDVVGEQMAGPGIRYFRLAQVLSREFEVVLVVPKGSVFAADLPLLIYASGFDECLEKAIGSARTVIIPAVQISQIPVLMSAQSPIHY